MLETIRGYAAEKLERAAKPSEVRRRHAEWRLRFAREVVGFPGLTVERSVGPVEVARFRDEYPNARSALAWAWSAGADELGLALGAACCRFWLGGALFRDVTTWLGEALPRIESAPAETRPQALKVAGLVTFFVLADSEQADVLWADAGAVATPFGSRTKPRGSSTDGLGWHGSKATSKARRHGSSACSPITARRATGPRKPTCSTTWARHGVTSATSMSRSASCARPRRSTGRLGGQTGSTEHPQPRRSRPRPRRLRVGDRHLSKGDGRPRPRP